MCFLNSYLSLTLRIEKLFTRLITTMNQMEQVATRLKGLRDALELSSAEIAKVAEISEETYLSYESGEADIPVSFLHRLANTYGVELTALLFGEDPKMTTYFVTRRGMGEKVERTKAYSYQSLAAGFAGRVMDPFVVTVEPTDKINGANTHQGQEFNLVIEGRMEITIGSNNIILNEGDSIMFSAKLPHKMRALDGKRVKFLAIIS